VPSEVLAGDKYETHGLLLRYNINNSISRKWGDHLAAAMLDVAGVKTRRFDQIQLTARPVFSLRKNKVGLAVLVMIDRDVWRVKFIKYILE
jgi:hypothetical protein